MNIKSFKNIKFIVFLSVFLFVATTDSAFAKQTSNGYYGGVALVGSGVLVDNGDNTDEMDGNSSISGGVYFGRKLMLFNNVFGAGEVFYHNSNLDDKSPNGDEIEVDSQYGVKAHIGFQWENKSIYGIIGTSHLGYDIIQNGVHKDESSFRSIMGIGASLQFNERISYNLEFMSTGDKVDIAGDDGKSVYLMTLRAGLSYHF